MNLTFTCNLSQETKPFPHFWEHTVGSGHAPLALRADWREQMRRCKAELGFRHVRFHALLSDEMGTLVQQESRFIYSFFNADRITDFLLSIGMRPFVELSFTPKAISSGPKTVFRYEANVSAPKSLRQWSALIRKLVSHWVQRYGAAEVREWFFEVWNEPNLGAFWTGTRKSYFELYRVTVEAVKRVDRLLRVGGPATAKNEWIPEFLEFCGGHDVPVDFISTHHYPTDALGKTTTNTRSQLQHAAPHMMREDAARVRSQAHGLPVYYTEWNISSNPRDSLHDEPFAAAYATKIIMENSGLVEGYSFWTFSDIFNENYFPSVPFHGGFGLLNLHGIAKPVYRAFELLHRLGTRSLRVEGAHRTVDVWAVQSSDSLTILITNHALPGHAIRTERVQLRLIGGRVPRLAYLERIDANHANPRAFWESMGRPEYPSASQVDELQAASRLKKEEQSWKNKDGDTWFAIAVPPHAIAALTLEFA